MATHNVELKRYIYAKNPDGQYVAVPLLRVADFWVALFNTGDSKETPSCQKRKTIPKSKPTKGIFFFVIYIIIINLSREAIAGAAKHPSFSQAKTVPATQRRPNRGGAAYHWSGKTPALR